MDSPTATPSTDDNERLARRVDAALPQTQCARCGYPDCAGYARAIAFDAAPINQCPPGGAQGITRLARITGRPGIVLNLQHGIEAPRQLALIDEAWCIGCTLCRDACPTDAILGLAKHMHTVIESRCTGCELCIPVCPVDCIALENASGERTGWDAWSLEQADAARAHYCERTLRLARARDEKGERPRVERPKDVPALAEPQSQPDRGDDDGSQLAQRKRSVIEAALARARARAGHAQHQSG